jgi:hypothetical protein
MPNFDRFMKRWAVTGTTSAPTANQADSGFGFLGQTPPSVELFNAIFQALDDKDNWLYTRISEILLAAGITPTDATQNQLLNALRTLFAPGFMSVTASQSIIVPAGVTRMHVRLWGGGGGGGGSYSSSGAGTGGGGGGFTEGIFPVTPNASIFVTIGLGGIGAPAAAIYTAQNGGTTSFGSFCSATGGAAGVGGAGLIAFGSVPGGMGFGGTLNLQGGSGGFGQTYLGNASGGGIGGPSPFGGAPSPLSIAGDGNYGVFPGGGATGAGSAGSVSETHSGGNGANGLAIIEW